MLTSTTDISGDASPFMPDRGTFIQGLVGEFLRRCTYISPGTTQDGELRQWLTKQVGLWRTELSPKFIEKTINASCTFVETVYSHTPAENRHYIALYNMCMFYADDLHGHDPGAIAHFTRRFAEGAAQPNPVLACLAGLLRRVYALWPPFCADSIVTGTLDALAANHVERMMDGVVVKPAAVRYPYYLRVKAGIGAPYTHFLFTSKWRETPESYLQILPEIDHWTLGTNDILSFYKEEIAGEDNNYVHLRAAADQSSVEDVLRRLIDEVVETAERVKILVADDQELLELWNRYILSYLEFHLKTPRYRLAELGFSA